MITQAQKYLLITMALLWHFPILAQEDWPHYVNDWSDGLFQARVQGVYDWTGSGPDRLETLEFTEVPINMYQLSTVNRDIEFFPPRDDIDPELKAFFPPPKDWEDRRFLILHLRSNSVPEEGYFENNLDERAGPDTYYLMGNIYFLQQKFTEAIENYEKAIFEFSRFRLAYKNMAYAYISLGDCDKALPAAETATELGAFSARLKGLIAYCSLQQGNYHSAAEAAGIARMLDHENEMWVELEIAALIKLGSYRQAKILLEKQLSSSVIVGRHVDYLIDIYRGEADQEALLAMLEIKKRAGVITESQLAELESVKISESVSRLIDEDRIADHLQNSSPSLAELLTILQDLINSNGWGAALEFSNNILDQLNYDLTPAEKSELSVLQARVMAETGLFDRALARLESVLLEFPMHCEALLLSAEVNSDQGQSDLADLYLLRAENSPLDCSNALLERHAGIMFTLGDYTRSLDLLQRDSQQRSVDGVIENRWQADKIKALADLVQLSPD
ncbi:MAG: tetratricopeptide repeat protein [Gammaproteobacteria bacterium]|nr:tetratricopeptide repeat protein [Gammaproteobacteria bacterium]